MKLRNIKFVVLAVLWLSTIGLAQDANTILLLRFEGSLNGEQGESPSQSSGHSFQTGIQAQGVLLPDPNYITYPSADNISATEGTIEFWIKPTQYNNNGQGRVILSWGGSGGFYIQTDGAGNFGLTLNRFGAFPGGEKGIGASVNSLPANDWHHIAFTYSNSDKKIRSFVNGEQQQQITFTGDLPAVSGEEFQLGGEGYQNNNVQATMDELQISGIARSPQQIAERYASALTITGLTAVPNTMQLLPTWWETPNLQVQTHIGTRSLPNPAANWTSSNPAVATFDTNRGKIIAHAAGTATVTASSNGYSAVITINVTAPVLPPTFEQINPHLSTPAAKALWEIPLVIINYLPTTDGVNIDSDVTFITGTLTDIRSDINRKNIQQKFMLEEGSRFRGYGSSSVNPSLGYRVVQIINVYEEMPLGLPTGGGAYFPDYEQILTRFGAENFVNDLGVKEFWIWGYHNDTIVPAESNMSSPTTGDVSNSYRFNHDMPVYDKTYVVYNYNVATGVSNAVHNHGHQLEAILAHANHVQDGNTALFWQKFATFGRAGNTHSPPNTVDGYDYENPALHPSDIADWKPDGGTMQPVNYLTWGNINYQFPDGIVPVGAESKWYIYWFQSMPGRGNTIPYGSNRMTNWWQFTGDWDGAMRAGIGLYEASSCTFSTSSAGQVFSSNGGNGSVTTTSPSGCKWFASSNAPWITLTSGDIGNGNGTVNFTVAPNNSGASRTTKIIVAGNAFTVTQDDESKAPVDFDGDGKTDISVFRPNRAGEWIYLGSDDGVVHGTQFGTASDILTPADYNGDGVTDLSFWRPSTASWIILSGSITSSGSFGLAGDIPVPADYDGDGKADKAVFRPSNSTWYIRRSPDGETTTQQFGAAGDKPVPADYNGDGRTDIAVFRPSTGQWRIKLPKSPVSEVTFGVSTDKPVPGDYTGDGKADLAFWRASTGEWFVLRSDDSSQSAVQFGTTNDIPVSGDYDGDGRMDKAVFRPSDRNWHITGSTAGYYIQQFGVGGDVPIPAALYP